MIRRTHLRFAGCALLAAAALGRVRGQSVATDLNEFVGDAAGYNVVALGNATFTGSSDINGALAVGGNLTVGGAWNFAGQNGLANNPSLYVKGTTSFSGESQLVNGWASLPKDTSANGYSWISGSYTLSKSGSAVLLLDQHGTNEANNPANNAAPTGLDLATSGAGSFSAISSSLAGMSASSDGTVSVQGQSLDFTTTATSGVVIFDLNASDFTSSSSGGVTMYDNSYNGSTFTNVSISVPTGVNYVINVLGLASNSEIFCGGVNFNAGTNDSQVLWNFNESNSTTISVGGDLYGSVLAPNANLTTNNIIDGTVVASSFTDNSVEIHDDDAFVSEVVPESGSFALWGLALCLALAAGGSAARRLLSRAGS